MEPARISKECIWHVKIQETFLSVCIWVTRGTTTDCMLLACDSHEQQSYACHVSDLAGVADAAANA